MIIWTTELNRWERGPRCSYDTKIYSKKFYTLAHLMLWFDNQFFYVSSFWHWVVSTFGFLTLSRIWHWIVFNVGYFDVQLFNVQSFKVQLVRCIAIRRSVTWGWVVRGLVGEILLPPKPTYFLPPYPSPHPLLPLLSTSSTSFSFAF